MRRRLLGFLCPRHLFHGQHGHSPQPHTALNGGHTDPLGRLNQQLWKFKQLKATSFLHSHISKEPHTLLVSSKPPFHTAWIHSCRAVLEARLSSPPPVSSQGGPWSSPHTQLLGDRGLWSTSHHHPLRKSSSSAQMP